MAERIKQRLPFEDCLPAGGQGAVGIECRTEDIDTLKLIDCLHHQETAARVTAERAVNGKLQGGCQVPIASFAELENEELTLRALVGTVDGKQLIQNELTGNSHNAEELGILVAEELLDMGAEEILASLRTSNEST